MSKQILRLLNKNYVNLSKIVGKGHTCLKTNGRAGGEKQLSVYGDKDFLRQCVWLCLCLGVCLD